MKKEYELKNLKKRKTKIKVDKDAAKVPISLRVDGSILSELKDEAQRLGLPYQTFISSILYQYTNDELISRKTVKILKDLKVS